MAAEWDKALLIALGVPVTKQNRRFLQNWQRWEGGHTKNKARFNWLNTTRKTPGAVGSINSVGVKAYRSFDEGILATVETLNNGKYQDVLDALGSGNPFKAQPTAGLSTWVSGSPTARMDYAAKVLGTKGAGKAPAVKPRPTRTGIPRSKRAFFEIAFDDDPEFVALLDMVSRQNAPSNPGEGPEHQQYGQTSTVPGVGTKYVKGTLVLPTQWKSTHPTSGLEDEGFNSAIDIMSPAGTPVGAPEDGVVLRWNPTGAQGGGSMWFRSRSGRLYWIGHIANGLQPGAKVRRGDVIAEVSADHARPHVHLDRRG